MLQGGMAGSLDSGGTCRAVPGLVPGHAGVRAAVSALVQWEGGGRARPAPDGAPRQDLQPRLPPAPDAISTRRC